jgi:hypothetical protein
MPPKYKIASEEFKLARPFYAAKAGKHDFRIWDYRDGLMVRDNGEVVVFRDFDEADDAADLMNDMLRYELNEVRHKNISYNIY